MWTECKLRSKLICATDSKELNMNREKNTTDSNREFGNEKKFPQKQCLKF